MDIAVAGRKVTVSDSLKEYAVDKLENATKVFDISPMTGEVVLRVEKNPSIRKAAICEITLRVRGHIIRVEAADEDMYAAVDIATDKVARQLRKYKTRVIDHHDRTKIGEVPSIPPRPLRLFRLPRRKRRLSDTSTSSSSPSPRTRRCCRRTFSATTSLSTSTRRAARSTSCITVTVAATASSSRLRQTPAESSHHL